MCNKFQNKVKVEANKKLNKGFEEIDALDLYPSTKIMKYLDFNFNKIKREVRKKIRKGPRL